MSDINPAVIKLTQDLLGKYVEKPQMTDKLLAKPPFRFLHDVIRSVIKSTGFLDGLYTEEELNHQNIKDKVAKIDFLKKTVDAVKLITKENLNVKPSKIVAGQEPDRTNELLQAIGRALDMKLSSKDAIKTLNSPNTMASANKSDKIPRSISKPMAQNKDNKSINPNQSKKSKIPEEQPKPSTKNTKKTETTDTKVKDKSVTRSKADKPRAAATKKNPEKIAAKSITIEKPVNIDESKVIESKTSGIPDKETSVKEPIYDSTVQLVEPEISDKKIPKTDLALLLGDDVIQMPVIDGEPEVQKVIAINDIQENPMAIPHPDSASEDLEIVRSASEKAKKHSDSITKSPAKIVETQIEKPSSPIPTAAPIEVESSKPIAIRPDNKEQKKSKPIRPRTSLRPPSVRPASARPGAPRQRDRNMEIVLQADENGYRPTIPIVDNFGPISGLDDEEDNLIIVEDPMIDRTHISDVAKGDADSLQGQGHLVQQILNTQKEFSQNDVDPIDSQRQPNEFLSNSSNQQRLSSAKQIESLRESIQKLTWSINPLGKLMDFLQEDIDSMQIELSMWRKILASTRADLKRESGLTQSAIQPLKQQLSSIEESTIECMELINASRLKVLQNEEMIFKFLNEL